jgi:hypothetical protein
VSLPPVSFPTLGWQVIDWIEWGLVHGPGDIEGGPIEVDDEIALFLCWLYRLHPASHKESGRRLIQRAVLSRPKGRAKSETAGEIVCAEALGPVRFDHWAEEGEVSSWGYEYAEGEPVGKPVRSPFIRCLATEEDQAGNTYDNVVVMLTQGKVAEEFGLNFGKEVGLTRTFLPGGGEIRPSTSGNESKDGGLESMAVADETHLYILPKLRRMYGTVSRNTGKRKEAEPWVLDTTTAWQPGERSVAEQAGDKYAHLDIEEAVLKRGVLYDHRQGDEPVRFGDNRSLIKALKTGYGPAADWMDFKRIVRLIRDAEDPENDAYRYWLNRPRAAASHWLSPEEVRAVIGKVTVERGAPIGLGFDGSENDDHTALKGCTEEGDLFTIGVWRPAGDDLGWREEVMDAVAWAFDHFDVVRFKFDPAWWTSEGGKWAAKHGSPPVEEFWTGGRSETRMAVATGALRTEVKHSTITIDPEPLQTEEIFVDAQGQPTSASGGTSLVQWHYENARTRKVRVKKEEDAEAEDAYLVRKERKGSALKIDSVTSDVLAKRARDDGIKLGEFEKRGKSFGRAAWQDGAGAKPRKTTPKSEYIPCRSCSKPIHPDLHKPDTTEKGLCMKCRLSGGR